MQSYKKKYLEEFNMDETDFFACEICGKEADEFHHILARSKFKHLLDDIMNLQAICRPCHEEYGDEVYTIPLLLKIHRMVLLINNIDFDNRHFIHYINMYTNKAKLKEGVKK